MPITTLSISTERSTPSFYYLEFQYTYNPLHNAVYNSMYDPNVKVLYAVWKKI